MRADLLQQPTAALSAWVISRLLGLGLVLVPAEQAVLSDVRSYRQWSYALWHSGQSPASNGHREYPFGALAVLLPAAGSAADYVPFFVEFVVLMLILDGFITTVLWRLGGAEHRSPAWTWVLVLPLLGPVVYTRFDLLPTSLAVVASISIIRRPALAGAAAVAGGCIKLWPLLLVPVLLLAPGRRRVVLGATGAAVVAAALAVALGEASSLPAAIRNQSSRGVQIESLPALGHLWWRVAGGPVRVVYLHGAWEAQGPGLDVTAGICLFGGAVLSLIALVLASRRGDLLLLPPALIGIAICTDKVLSPQYTVWLLALVCVALLHRSLPRWLYICLAMTMVTTHLVYPLSYIGLLDGGIAQLALLTARDALLLAISAWLVGAATHVRFWHE